MFGHQAKPSKVYKFGARLDPQSDQLIRDQMRLASPYDLVETLAGRFAEAVRVDPKNTTQTCSHCGKLMQFDAAVKMLNRCRHCGTLMDQDDNAARNLLAAASGQVVAKSR